MTKPIIEFIAASLTQPRLINRASTLSKLFHVNVAGFERGLYDSNQFPGHIAVENLGLVKAGLRMSRLAPLLKLFSYLLKRTSASSWVYATSFDGLAASILCGRRKLIYEIGDLRTVEAPNSLIARLERFLISRYCVLVVVTSPGFYSEYFARYKISDRKFIVLENKIQESEEHVFLTNRPANVSDRLRVNSDFNTIITIGVVGFLRYRKPLAFLKRWVLERKDEYRLEVFGDGLEKDLFTDLAAGEETSIMFNGPFKSPDALFGIYNSIDICFSAYDSESRNVRLAIPNKYFQCGYFRVPILVSKDTAVASLVNQNGVGQSIDLSSYKNFRTSMNMVTREAIEGWRNRLARQDRVLYVAQEDNIARIFIERMDEWTDI